jgi:hypothetical protein
MTRAERAAEKVRKAQEKRAEAQRLAKERDAVLAQDARQAEAMLRQETRSADNKRCFAIGMLAKEQGLFAWSNADMQAVFAVLARLASSPHPATVLEVLLADPHGYREITLSRPIFSEPFSHDHREENPDPFLETSEESDRREVTKKGPAAAGV